MICTDVQKKIHDYLEDMLAEPMWLEMNAHLKSCRKCRAHEHRISSLAGDLKRLAPEVEIPFDVGGAVIERLEIKKEKRTETRKTWKRNTAIALTGILAVVFVVKAITFVPAKLEFESETTLADKEAAAMFKELEALDARLAKVTGDDKVEEGSTVVNRSVVASLEPFHWKFLFDYPGNRSQFIGKVKKIAESVSFKEPYFMVIRIDQEVLGELLAVVQGLPGLKVEGELVDPKTLPKSRSLLKITMQMSLTQPELADVVDYQMHFMLANSFLLERRLKAQGFGVPYSSPDLVIVNSTHVRYQELIDLFGGIPGLVVQSNKKAPAIKKSSKKPLHLILYLEQR